MAPHVDRSHGLHPASPGNDEEAAKPGAGGARRNGPAIKARPPESLQRAVSDVSAELGRPPNANARPSSNPGAAAEVQSAQCECCGLGEECTPTYISRVRDRFCGRWICGLCAEAVGEERKRMGRGTPVEDALRAHMALCLQFNRLARTNPTLYMADAMRQLLRKSSRSHADGLRSNPGSPRRRDVSGNSRGGIIRSSSCIPALTRDRNSRP